MVCGAIVGSVGSRCVCSLLLPMRVSLSSVEVRLLYLHSISVLQEKRSTHLSFVNCATHPLRPSSLISLSFPPRQPEALSQLDTSQSDQMVLDADLWIVRERGDLCTSNECIYKVRTHISPLMFWGDLCTSDECIYKVRTHILHRCFAGTCAPQTSAPTRYVHTRAP